MTGRICLPKIGLKALMFSLLIVISSVTATLAFSDQWWEGPATEQGHSAEDENLAQPESILTLLNAYRSEAEFALGRVDDRILVMAQEYLKLGEKAASEAIQLVTEGDHKSAMYYVSDALGFFGDIILMAYGAELASGQEGTGEGGADDARALLDAMDRAHSLIVKVRASADPLEERGFDVSKAVSLLDKAEDLLQLAQHILEDGDIVTAAREISAAEGMLTQAIGALQTWSDEIKAEKASEFLEKAEKRLRRLEERVVGLLGNQSLDPAELSFVSQVFEEAMNRIRRIEALIETGDLNSAMEEFEGTFEDTYEMLETVERLGRAKVDKLRTVDKLEAEGEHLEEMGEKLKEEGADTSRLEEKVTGSKDQLEEAVMNLEEGEEETAGDNIEEAEELVEEAKKELKAIEEMCDESEKSSK